MTMPINDAQSPDTINDIAMPAVFSGNQRDLDAMATNPSPRRRVPWPTLLMSGTVVLVVVLLGSLWGKSGSRPLASGALAVLRPAHLQPAQGLSEPTAARLDIQSNPAGATALDTSDATALGKPSFDKNSSAGRRGRPIAHRQGQLAGPKEDAWLAH